MGRAPTKGKGRPCDTAVVPFGEVVMFRLPEVARDRHQALEMGKRYVDWPFASHVRNAGGHGPWSEKGLGRCHQAAARGPTVGRGEIEEDEGAPDTVEVGQRG